jgi:hypothetical protein
MEGIMKRWAQDDRQVIVTITRWCDSTAVIQAGELVCQAPKPPASALAQEQCDASLGVKDLYDDGVEQFQWIRVKAPTDQDLDRLEFLGAIPQSVRVLGGSPMARGTPNSGSCRPPA